jgi:hypothetical protein
MEESLIDKLLANIPGSKRAAQGVILPGDNGTFFHVLNTYDKNTLAGLTQDEHFFLAFCAKNEILRLRELRGAHDYLLRLRANAIVDSPRVVRVMTSRRKSFERSGRPWSLTHYYHSRDEYHKAYINNLKRSDAKALRKIPSGLAFVSEVNALCIRSLAGDLVVASESLEYFFYFMTIAFYGLELGIEPIDRADALLIAIRIMNGAEALDFDIDPRGNLEHEIDRTLKGLVKAQMQFTFGHEYAHLLCGHLSSPDISNGEKSSESNTDPLVSLRTYDHDLEYMADYFALKNIEHKHNTYHPVAQGAFSVLLYLHFLQEVRELCGLKTLSVSATHPTPKDRIIKLHMRLGKKSPLNEEVLADLFSVSNELSEILAHRLKNSSRKDILTFYGSIYLPSYISRIKLDRYDF